jgi:glutathione synthase/RimK-type ligase-like ATP-grasp enzyme
LRIARGADLAEALAGSPAEGRMIQPFLPAVADEGELSVFVFGGRFSHAVRKQAKGGDFRVQPQFGAHLEAMEPEADMLALARAALDAAPPGVLYARIDMVRDADGVLRLMELEAIEPDLYFAFARDKGEALGLAVLERLGLKP